MTQFSSRRSAYSLIEILVVTAVIGTIMAIIIPFFGPAKRQSNESSAIATMRTISTAQLQYRTRFGTYADVTGLEQAGLLDPSFQDSEKAGYRFVSPNPPTDADWQVEGWPVLLGVTGERYFYVDVSGVIRFQESSPATVADQPVD